MKLDGKRRRTAEFQMMQPRGRDNDRLTWPDVDRMLRVVFKHEDDSSGVNNQTTPHAVSDAMRPKQSLRHTLIVEDIRRPYVHEIRGKFSSFRQRRLQTHALAN